MSEVIICPYRHEEQEYQGGQNMKTSEFIRQVNSLGYTAYIDESSKLLYITDEILYLAVISLIEQYRFDLAFKTKKEMDDLYSLIENYIRTPIEERKGSELFYVKHKHFPEEDRYLNLDIQGNYFAGTKNNADIYKTQFTLEEINQIPWELGEEWEKKNVKED